jgi:hypothetical protein
LAIATATLSQTAIDYRMENAEYGKLSELKGKTKLFLVVDDFEARNIIVKAVEKAGISLVNRREDADFGMRLWLQRVDVGSNVLLGTSHNIVLVGELWVYTYLPVKENETVGKVRMLWQKRKSQDWSGGITLNRHPATNTINDFVKDWKKLK